MFREMFQGMCEQDVGRDLTRDRNLDATLATFANYHDISADLPYWKDQDLFINMLLKFLFEASVICFKSVY